LREELLMDKTGEISDMDRVSAGWVMFIKQRGIATGL